jgi:hypothetical protein
VRLRRSQIERVRAELEAENKRLELHGSILDAKFDGVGLTEADIAKRFGRRSHSFVAEQLTEIRVAARSTLGNSVALLCLWCGKPIERVRVGPGRFARYCCDRHRWAARRQRSYWRAKMLAHPIVTKSVRFVCVPAQNAKGKGCRGDAK